jgi:hypothetical protein
MKVVFNHGRGQGKADAGLGHDVVEQEDGVVEPEAGVVHDKGRRLSFGQDQFQFENKGMGTTRNSGKR